MPDVRFGSKADISLSLTDVRFTLESGHGSARLQVEMVGPATRRDFVSDRHRANDFYLAALITAFHEVGN
jgi:hypothetical protein